MKIVALDDWASARTAARVFGGQGTVNTAGGAPDSSAFTYVAYPDSV
ncbi:hypothetical protein ABZ905_11950 [Streptomyces parvus]